MNRETEVAELERQIWAVLAHLSNRRFGDAIVRVTGYNLPPASWTLLEFLDRSGPIRVSDIAAYSDIDVSSVTPRLKALEADGFIERGSDPADGRVSLISIGPLGHDAVERMHKARCDVFHDGLADMDSARIIDAADLLEQLSKWLESSEL
ncbi:transcriptional regulator [Brucella pseudogrignonensis]|uniref:MarR family transcriptional regulator n=1 Tax=Brucella pseudogrignonensis TaxID=419475 RepID=A0A7Y3WUB7_9HYPH|nr:MarR family transcriptional regulator [Brucella pseudogrignonensis]MCM0752644.1 transcriptional regulator [Brucella pseudogrignonensis]NNV19090.1 MarR family transcriptional regulator [Brucella pseudogrignonensis]